MYNNIMSSVFTKALKMLSTQGGGNMARASCLCTEQELPAEERREESSKCVASPVSELQKLSVGETNKI